MTSSVALRSTLWCRVGAELLFMFYKCKSRRYAALHSVNKYQILLFITLSDYTIVYIPSLGTPILTTDRHPPARDVGLLLTDLLFRLLERYAPIHEGPVSAPLGRCATVCPRQILPHHF